MKYLEIKAEAEIIAAQPKHTPGDWICSRSDMRINRGSDGKQVSYVYFPPRPDGTEVERVQIASDNPVADACLMAAAPKMLKLLESLLNFDGECKYPDVLAVVKQAKGL